MRDVNGFSALVYGERARVVLVIDGNTLDLEMDLGSGCTLRRHCRLDGVVAPELDDPDREERRVARLAKDFVEVLVLGREVAVRFPQATPDERGRWPAVVFWQDAAGTWSRLNEDLVENGLAAAVYPGQEASARGDVDVREAVA